MAAALFFDFGEIGSFIPVGFEVVIRVVVPGDRVEARSFGGAATNEDVSHADERGRVHATAEFCQDRPIRTESVPDSLRQRAAKMLFVFGVGALADFLLR